MQSQWFVIHTLTGQEEKVRTSLEKAIQAGKCVGVAQVVVPMEKVSEVKGGKKKISERRVFPGYVLVEMSLSDDTWYMIKTTPGVAGFVGSGLKPVPLRARAVMMVVDVTLTGGLVEADGETLPPGRRGSLPSVV